MKKLSGLNVLNGNGTMLKKINVSSIAHLFIGN